MKDNKKILIRILFLFGLSFYFIYNFIKFEIGAVTHVKNGPYDGLGDAFTIFCYENFISISVHFMFLNIYRLIKYKLKKNMEINRIIAVICFIINFFIIILIMGKIDVYIRNIYS